MLFDFKSSLPVSEFSGYNCIRWIENFWMNRKSKSIQKIQLKIYLSKITIDTEFKTVPKNQCKIN